MSDGTKAQFSNNSYGTGQFIAKLYNQAENAPEFRAGHGAGRQRHDVHACRSRKGHVIRSGLCHIQVDLETRRQHAA
jgi:hypothetical protein